MDGNGKVFRVLFDALLMRSDYYPSLFNREYQKDSFYFGNAIANFTTLDKQKGYEEFLKLLLRPVYKESYFS